MAPAAVAAVAAAAEALLGDAPRPARGLGLRLPLPLVLLAVLLVLSGVASAGAWAAWGSVASSEAPPLPPVSLLPFPAVALPGLEDLLLPLRPAWHTVRWGTMLRPIPGRMTDDGPGRLAWPGAVQPLCERGNALHGACMLLLCL